MQCLPLTLRALAAISLACLGLGLSHAQTAPDSAASTLPSADPAKIPELRPGSGYLIGYLQRKDLPNSLQLLPAPPTNGSAAAAADLAFHEQLQAQRSGPRWELAAQDAVLKFPAVASTFSCALGVSISPETTPHLTMVLRRSLADAGLSTYAAKEKYQVPRPFVKLAQPSCSPGDETALARDGSYPSGHAAVGWAWGLILTELAPERSQALLERAAAFGQSRAVCAVHWKSDIEAGQRMGAATLAKLHSNADFLAQLGAARAEIAQARAQGSQPNRDCAAEANALALDRQHQLIAQGSRAPL